MYKNVKCPHCGESYFTILYETCTAVHCPLTIKDGKVIGDIKNKDNINIHTMHCRCEVCKKEFEFSGSISENKEVTLL